MGLVYIMFNKTEVYVNPGIVTRAPSPVAAPVLPTNWSYPPKIKNISYSPQTNYQKSAHHMPSVPMQSVGLYMTSSAQVHSVGGGGNGYGIATTSSGSASRGIQYSSSYVMPATSFVAMASNRTIAQPESQDAPQMARLASISTRRAPGPPNTGEDPLDPNNQLPIGTPLTLALLAIGYTCSIALARKEQK